jgi:signal transduction histidine kinase
MKGIQYELNTQKLLTKSMNIDQKKLKQVMFLLLYNALKHTTVGRILIIASDKK